MIWWDAGERFDSRKLSAEGGLWIVTGRMLFSGEGRDETRTYGGGGVIWLIECDRGMQSGRRIAIEARRA